MVKSSLFDYTVPYIRVKGSKSFIGQGKKAAAINTDVKKK